MGPPPPRVHGGFSQRVCDGVLLVPVEAVPGVGEGGDDGDLGVLTAAGGGVLWGVGGDVVCGEEVSDHFHAFSVSCGVDSIGGGECMNGKTPHCEVPQAGV